MPLHGLLAEAFHRRCLEDASPRVRQAAAEALGKLGASAAAPAYPALRKCLEDWDEDVRSAAATSLRQFRKDSDGRDCPVS